MKGKIKIGILIRQFDTLSNWELRIIDKIFSNENLELSLLIKDGRKGNDNPSTLSKRLRRLIKSKKYCLQ